MTLTRTERYLISNQLLILEKLDKAESEKYEYWREIVEQGFSSQYEEIMQHVCENKDTISVAECDEVQSILNMYDEIGYTYHNLQNKGGIEKAIIEFSGFHANTEHKQLRIAKHLYPIGGDYFPRIYRGSDDLDSHCPNLDMYRRMLREWQKSKNKLALTHQDLTRIISVQKI